MDPLRSEETEGEIPGLGEYPLPAARRGFQNLPSRGRAGIGPAWGPRRPREPGSGGLAAQGAAAFSFSLPPSPSRPRGAQKSGAAGWGTYPPCEGDPHRRSESAPAPDCGGWAPITALSLR